MRNWFSDLLSLLAFGLVLNACVHVFALKADNFPNYLPAPSYAAGMLDLFFWISLGLGVLLSSLLFGRNVLEAYRRRPHRPHNEDLSALCMAMLFWGSIYICFVGTGPLILSYVAGEKQRFTYTADGMASDYRACSHAVHLEGLSYWGNKLCGVSDEMLERLARCDRITVEGVGTRFGLRVSQIVAIDTFQSETRVSAFQNCPA